MDFQIYSKNLTVTDSLKEYLQMRLNQVDKVSSEILSCRVDISRDTHHRKGDVFRVEINVTMPKKLIRIVETKQDARSAIDIGSEKIKRQVKKFTEKRRDRARRISKIFSKLKGR